jgi:hypothetical protein
VLFKDDPFSVTLPHIAGEWKGRGKDMAEAKMQSAYDGAAIVYARNQALSYVGVPDPPGHAEVATFTTDGTTINFFAHYADTSEDGMLEYHQYPVTSTNLTNSYEDFKKGRKQLRNLQDIAKYSSYAVRDRLKGHWKAHRPSMPSIHRASNGLSNVPEEPELEDHAGQEAMPAVHQTGHPEEKDYGAGKQEQYAGLLHQLMPNPEALANTGLWPPGLLDAGADPGHDIVHNPVYVASPPGFLRQAHQRKPNQRGKTASAKGRLPPTANPKHGTEKKRRLSRKAGANVK